MTTCETTRPAPFRCPTASEVLASVLALLPKGRAWQSNEGGPISGLVRGFSLGAFDEGFQTQSRPAAMLWAFWSAIAEVLTFVNQRLCDARLEFWCATQSETRDLWMAEYGLPDACDPFPDLCTKVAALGGIRCEYYAAIAARAGWSIACRDYYANCGSKVGCAKAGQARPGNRRAGGIMITVNLGSSPAFKGTLYARPLAGRMKAGRRLACGPDLSPLECLMARIVHADNKITYEVSNG